MAENHSTPLRYPKPGPIGGRLIRQMITLLREFNEDLPVTSHILCGVSGGADSVALAILLAKYGRRVVDPSRLSFLHINHRWRGKESDQDACFVRELGKKLGVPVSVKTLKGPPDNRGESWENEARKARKEIFAAEAEKKKALVFTAHHSDDLAETMLWRIFTGALQTHGGGIGVKHGVEIRPFLRIRKKDLQAFLQEEEQHWREDSTNSGDRFLRARLRNEIMPSVEKLFPKAVVHLTEMGLAVQKKESEPLESSVSGDRSLDAIYGTLAGLGLRLRRSHLTWVSEKSREKEPWRGEIDLPEGWRLTGERQSLKKGREKRFVERWVLERDKALDLK